MESATDRFVEGEAYRLAASLSFYALSSVFPLLLVAVAVGDLVLGSSVELQDELVASLDGMKSPLVRTLVDDALSSAQSSGAREGLGLALGIAGAIIGASSIFVELDAAFEKLFGAPSHRLSFKEAVVRFLRERTVAFGLVLGTSLLLLVSTVAFAALDILLQNIDVGSPLLLIGIARGATFGMLLIALTLCYRVVPDRRVSLRAALSGGALAAAALTLAGPILGWAVTRLTNVAAYGVAGGLLLLSTWFYVACNVLLFGGAVAAVHDAQTSRSETPHLEPPPRRSLHAQ